MSSLFTDIPVRRRSLLRLALATGFGLNLAACGGGSDDPAPDETAALLQTQADAAVAAGLVGLALGLVRAQDGDLTSRVALAGRRRLGQAAALDAQDRLAIGSNTKAMSCAAILALAERGGPALSQRLPQLFAEGAGEIHPAYAQVTLADLLHHRGGLPAFDGSASVSEEEAFIAALQADPNPLPDTAAGRRAYFARWLLAQAPAAGLTPGQDFRYSNAGYALAAAAVEAQTGSRFDALFDERLLQPLALPGAWRSAVPGDDDTLWGHEGAAGALSVVQATPDAVATRDWQDALLAPAGHWACTGQAYAAWLRWHVLALRGQPTPLPQAYVNDLRAASDSRYVWGWQSLATPRRTLLTHTGHQIGFMAEAVLDRDGDFALFGLSNTAHVAADGSSWVLSLIDVTLAEVLRRQQIAL